MAIEFKEWPKTPRLFRDIIITEKIDGTNAAVIVTPLGDVLPREGIFSSTANAIEYAEKWCGPGVGVQNQHGAFLVSAQSRKRLITPDADNYGFAAWVHAHAQELAAFLGAGYHYGEWWGSGINRRYDLPAGERRFSLFNVDRYADLEHKVGCALPELGLVPVLYRGPFSEVSIQVTLDELAHWGSVARPGFKRPEGIVVFHSASRQVYKVLIENDALPKSLTA